MCKPLTHDKDKLQGALCEVVSAMSALNMYPDPLLDAEGKYLSQSDGWAQHCMEHLRAVFDLIEQAHKERELLKTKIYRLEVKLAEMGSKS